MEASFAPALIAGVERLTAWADLLDEINVFPVADGDTGRNLVTSLSPLRRIALEREKVVRELLMAARGNSGNIAARFLSGLLTADSPECLAAAVRLGRNLARQAVADPKPGTMLTIFDALVEALEEEPATWDVPWRDRLLDRLEGAVLSTTEALPRLKAAGVVDAGALGAFLFLEGFIDSLVGGCGAWRPIMERFGERLRLAPAFREEGVAGCCIDTVLKVQADDAEAIRRLSDLGESVVLLREGEVLKVHLHAEDEKKAREDLAAFGQVLRWATDDLGDQVRSFQQLRDPGSLHVVTDAAGSLNRELAARLGITLLESYITIGEAALPETHLDPADLYAAMGRGERVSTSQASLFERHQCYGSLLDRYPRLLYLCVGSVFTGNYAVAMQWKRENDPDGRFRVIDTGAASGRLGLLAVAVARFARKTGDAEAVIRYAEAGAGRCEEFVFLDQLRYLAAGGRLSRTGALAGDLFHLKPVISPLPEGARRVGICRDRDGQLRFALEKLKGTLKGDGTGALILLEHTDNAPWVEESVRPAIARSFPAAEILCQPMSLTAGAHMGPGTWGVAFLPAEE
ncbi:MAG: DegV family EDD domain-containing protein [Deltaproteobacteria bacterium]|nr:DegV family EDD domain-containing protein [Deltaproteobacteria bacterium]